MPTNQGSTKSGHNKTPTVRGGRRTRQARSGAAGDHPRAPWVCCAQQWDVKRRVLTQPGRGRRGPTSEGSWTTWKIVPRRRRILHIVASSGEVQNTMASVGRLHHQRISSPHRRRCPARNSFVTTARATRPRARRLLVCARRCQRGRESRLAPPASQAPRRACCGWSGPAFCESPQGRTVPASETYSRRWASLYALAPVTSNSAAPMCRCVLTVLTTGVARGRWLECQPCRSAP
jgi:hypothetical protein